MGLITGIHHVALKCKGQEAYEKTLQFYGEVLQLPVKRQWATGTMLDTGAGLMEIFNNAEDELPAGVIRHFAFAVSDVDKLTERAREAGYEILIEPRDICIPAEIPFPARIAFVIGPLGEEIELFCEK